MGVILRFGFAISSQINSVFFSNAAQFDYWLVLPFSTLQWTLFIHTLRFNDLWTLLLLILKSLWNLFVNSVFFLYLFHLQGVLQKNPVKMILNSNLSIVLVSKLNFSLEKRKKCSEKNPNKSFVKIPKKYHSLWS